MDAALRALKSGVRGSARERLTGALNEQTSLTSGDNKISVGGDDERLPTALDFFGDQPPVSKNPARGDERGAKNSEIGGNSFKKKDAQPTKQLLSALPAPLAKAISTLGVTQLTPVQRRAIPLFAERDVVAVAPTGSGKTYAYVLPTLVALNSLSKEELKEKHVRALILVPTRELATQVTRVIQLLLRAAASPIRVREVSSKATSRAMKGALAHIVVATPQSAWNAYSSKNLLIGRVRHVVLDEADRLLDINFLEQVDNLLEVTGKEGKDLSRVHLFSATLPGAVEVIARSLLRDPVKVVVAGGAYGGAAAVTNLSAQIKQKFTFVGGRGEQGKVLAVRTMLKEGLAPPVLLFVQSRDRAAELFRELVYEGVSVDAIHADRTNAARVSAIQRFRNGTLSMLIATDVLARGLDFLAVNTVINYDVPTDGMGYVHRIGRTGRNGRSGEAITLFTEEDAQHLPGILKMAKASGAEVPEWALKLKTVTRKEKVAKLKKLPPKRKRLGGPNCPKVSERDAKYRLPKSRDDDDEDAGGAKDRKKKKRRRTVKSKEISLEENEDQ